MKPLITSAVILLTTLMVSCREPGGKEDETQAAAPAPGPLTAIRVEQGPALDGRVDEMWDRADTIKVTVSEGVNLPGGSTELTLKALYSEDTLYLLAQWNDPTRSHQRSPWKKEADGSWIMLVDPNDQGGDNNKYYEDKLSVLWDINMKDFAEAGCALSCHSGEAGKPYGNKYTANPGELGDLWHWKSVRTGPVGQIDDQYLDSTRYDKEKAPRAGRNNDPTTGGGYVANITEDGKGPRFAARGNKPAPPYWIMDGEKVALDEGAYAAGDEVAGVLVAPIAGDRGDISAQANWNDGVWTLEMSRRLETGSRFDVQFDDLDKVYPFGIAVFDNAQVRHAFAALPSRLVFRR